MLNVADSTTTTVLVVGRRTANGAGPRAASSDMSNVDRDAYDLKVQLSETIYDNSTGCSAVCVWD
eukprot:6204421-Pleurochrysis_carterae.AAC.3